MSHSEFRVIILRLSRHLAFVDLESDKDSLIYFFIQMFYVHKFLIRKVVLQTIFQVFFKGFVSNRLKLHLK